MDQAIQLWAWEVSLLSAFAPVFTRPGWVRFVQWVTGRVLCWEGHTLTRIVTALGLESRWRVLEHFAEYGAWAREALERHTLRLLEPERSALWGHRNSILSASRIAPDTWQRWAGGWRHLPYWRLSIHDSPSRHKEQTPQASDRQGYGRPSGLSSEAGAYFVWADPVVIPGRKESEAFSLSYLMTSCTRYVSECGDAVSKDVLSPGEGREANPGTIVPNSDAPP